jgi:tubulin-specific chaperone C
MKELQNQWDQVDDFTWLKSEPSPHWRVMSTSERIKDDIWREFVPGGPGLGLEQIFSAVSLY